MRSNKLLFHIFLVLYFIAGLSLLITGSVAHRHATKYSEITGYSLISGAGFIIALGVIIIVLSAVGFIGAYKNRLSLLQIFIGTLIIILLLQLIASIVAFTLHNKAEDQLRTKLFKTLPDYDKNSNVRNEWDRLQQTMSCCGVDNATDWEKTRHEYPTSCCINNVCKTEESGKNGTFTTGCYVYARNMFYRYSKALGGVTIFFFFVEIVGAVLAIHLLRDLKNNYGSV
ncbi:unnamed protein product [Adineta steineri]|uniref:Tetraspanin n=1 Tax=Adineta steineri TaxID=433720 RepID=A0A814S7E3_9BILA|nr:unnamed protein product [Adineta steineri]CAF1144193.1 unnamed protein product [Adineta steineri]CAF1176547.1 unnamed protein product [Adineta steineri]CAF3519929.1 unnamed protein product [Adineta steineri]CAF3582580.1 unnamed protein product [Adineta steineri]